MEAVILAGGKGTRLRPHTDEIPKPLVPVGGKPIVEILLRQMQRTGVTRIHMAVNHLADRIVDELGDGSKLDLSIAYSYEKKTLSTIGPLKLIRNLPDDFIVANADVLTDLNFKSLYEHHIANKAIVTVATYERANPIDYGVLTVDENGLALTFNEKPLFNFTVSMGIYVLSRKVLEHVPKGAAFGFDNLMFELLDKSVPINTYPYQGYWLDIGRPDDYQKANDDIERIKQFIS